jgi:hypothetical protein
MVDAIRQIGVSEVTYYRWRQEFGGLKTEQESGLRESAQGDKWSFCLTAGKIGPRIRREHEQKTAPEPCIGL